MRNTTDITLNELFTPNMQFLIDPLDNGVFGFLFSLMIKVIFQNLLEFSFIKLMIFFKIPKLPSRLPPIMKGHDILYFKDYFYITCSQIMEVIYVSHIFYFVIYNEKLKKNLDLFTIPSTVLPLYGILFINDLYFTPIHYLMHLPYIYPYIHKHHHRQSLPSRGYIDAINETLIDQLIGISCIVAAVYTVYCLIDVHVLGITLFFIIFGVFTGQANHLGYDLRVPFLFFESRNHEIHHRFPKTNFGNVVMVYDYLMGTFKPYSSGQR